MHHLSLDSDWPSATSLVLLATNVNHMTKKVMFHLISMSSPQNVMIPLLTPWGSCGADIYGVIWPKSHVAPHFDHLDLRNAMIPLMILSASYYADVNGITWPQSHVAPYFSCFNLRNAVVPLIMLHASCDTDYSASGIKWPRSDAAPHFNYHALVNKMVPLGNTLES